MTAIPGYEVVRELGRGGMGVVLLARDKDGREVAVKILQNLTKESLLQRFQREERLQGLLTGQDSFVSLLATGETAEGPFLVMPYFAGGTLRDRLQRGMLGLDDALSLLHALGVALGKAHEVGIVHRDMKPENVLFDGTGKPFVADLGLAKHFRRDLPGGSKSINVTRTGQTLGTTGYMAIEQMRDAQTAGPPADVFALGAMLYECLAGRCPAYINRKTLASLRPDLPAWVSDVAEHALARKMEDRLPDGTAFARALAEGEKRLLSGAPVLIPLPPSSAAIPAGPLKSTETKERFLDEAPVFDDARPGTGATTVEDGGAPGFVSQTPEERASAPVAVAAPASPVAAPVSPVAAPVSPVTAPVSSVAVDAFRTPLPIPVRPPAPPVAPVRVTPGAPPAHASIPAPPRATPAPAPAPPRATPAPAPPRSTPAPPPTPPAPVVGPAPEARASLTWLWVILLVAAGVGAGIVFDRLLR
jgi:serine/threonine-protein kinase